MVGRGFLEVCRHWPGAPYAADNTGPRGSLTHSVWPWGWRQTPTQGLNPGWLFYTVPERRTASAFVNVWRENQRKSNILGPVTFYGIQVQCPHRSLTGPLSLRLPVAFCQPGCRLPARHSLGFLFSFTDSKVAQGLCSGPHGDPTKAPGGG